MRFAYNKNSCGLTFGKALLCSLEPSSLELSPFSSCPCWQACLSVCLSVCLTASLSVCDHPSICLPVRPVCLFLCVFFNSSAPLPERRIFSQQSEVRLFVRVWKRVRSFCWELCCVAGVLGDFHFMPSKSSVCFPYLQACLRVMLLCIAILNTKWFNCWYHRVNPQWGNPEQFCLRRVGICFLCTVNVSKMRSDHWCYRVNPQW